MLISQVADEDVKVDDRGRGEQGEDGQTQYQTASDLFDIMSQNNDLKLAESESLSTRDLVLLYKNIELGTQLMTSANEFKRKTPNQYVETVIYNEESDDSDASEIYGNEDLHNIVSLNKERIDLLTTGSSFGNTLCQKFGDFQLQNCGSSACSTCSRNFLLKDVLKEQLHSLSLVSNSINSAEKVLPDCLLDYICCKRLEDNYNFYMENIITYVKHTIEQLKRISNGEYLTDKAKAKWKEAETFKRTIDSDNDNTKVLAKSTSIPLYVERKFNGNKITWDDIVHSEVDVRSLSKLLKKKIILEMPKIILGSYGLFSKRCSDNNVVISCKRELEPIAHEDASRVDVYLKLKRSDSGHVMSNITSILILQTVQSVITESCTSEVLALPVGNKQDSKDYVNKKVEQSEGDVNGKKELKDTFFSINTKDNKLQEDNQTELSIESVHDTENTDSVGNNYASVETDSFRNEISSDNELNSKFHLEERHNPAQDTLFDFCKNDDLRYPMQSLIITTLPEEVSDDVCQPIVKKKSFSGIRIKSPYENKSYVMDEKKRRKLLEIREKREKKKLALNESSKVTKHKFVRTSVLAQATSSVTKLSITNKSFYNSIYGSSTAVNAPNQEKINGRRCSKGDFMINIPLERQSSLSTPEKHRQKYINRNYYLDDTVTEMMFTEINENDTKLNSDGVSLIAGSVESNEFNNKLKILSQLINNSNDSDVLTDLETSRGISEFNQATEESKALTDQNIISNVGIVLNNNLSEDDTLPPTLKCRKSIDKIYNLINKTSNKQNDYKAERKSNSTEKFKCLPSTNQKGSVEQESESGTSLKHHMSSIPSNFTFNENNNQMFSLNSSSQSVVVPKVIISTKQHISEDSKEHFRKEGKKFSVKRNNKASENPIQAISKLLQEFDNVQRTKQTELQNKKNECTNSGRGIKMTQNKKYVPNDLNSKSNEPRDRHSKIIASNKKKNMLVDESVKLNQEISDNHHKSAKKKIFELLDEVKEARGEAVRGPSKLTSRLNTLAQPKKTYVQAHREEYQTKYGKNFVSDRLQRHVATSNSAPDKSVTNIKKKLKRPGDQMSNASPKQTSFSPIVTERSKVGGYSQGNANKSEKISGRRATLHDPFCKRNGNTEIWTGNKVEPHINNSRALAELEYENFSTLRKSRAPFIPKYIEVESVGSSPNGEGSSVIGNKLHEIVNDLIKKDPSLKSIQSKAKLFSNEIILEQRKGDCVSESTQNNKLTNENNIIKEPGDNIHDDTLDVKITHENKIECFETISEAISNPAAEMIKLEKALYRQISTGTFQKRLRIKNLTLTPKQSMQQIVVLHSGDTGSIVLKNVVSENIKITASKSEQIFDLKKLQAISNSHLDWTFSNMPMQIATIGYALPISNCKSKALNFLPQENTLHKGVATEKNPRSTNTRPKDQTLKDNLEQIFFENFHLKNVSKHEDSSNNIKLNTMSDEMIQQVQSDSIVIKQSKLEIIENIEKKNKLESDDSKIDYSTSLDLLVGILSEIQKITTCQTNITNNLSSHPETVESNSCLKFISNTHGHEKTVCCDVVSITSLDKLRNLDSSSSLYSFYLSNSSETTKEAYTNVPSIIGPTTTFSINLFNSIDKEVAVNIPKYNIVDTFTATSQPNISITENRSTSVSLSSIAVNDCPILSSHSLKKENSIVGNKKNINEKVIIPYNENTTIFNEDFKRKRIGLLKNTVNVGHVSLTNETNIIKDISMNLVGNKNTIEVQSKHCPSEEMDPIMKMKQDILGTTYCLLVFVVFAALSLPDLMWYRL